MLIAAMNPCPCGYLGDPKHECRCTSTQIQNYQKKLSGPFLDRIDLYVEVEKVNTSDLFDSDSKQTNHEHNVVKNNITDAMAAQNTRYGHSDQYNSSLTTSQLTRFAQLDFRAHHLLKNAAAKLHLSARAYFKVIKVAQTIADLDHSPLITSTHLAEALSFRKR